MEGTFLRFAAELAKALDDADNLRVLPVVTFGAAENVSDLLYLKGIDIAITHADVFDEFRRNRKAANVDKRINYISQMYVGELHVFARHDIKSIKDLDGKKVGFHTKGAGPTITGPILFERLTARWTCGNCGEIWNTQTRPPAVAGVCDRCGGALRQRADDRPEAVTERLAVYRLETEPLLDYYSSRSVLLEIDANRSPDLVLADLLAELRL